MPDWFEDCFLVMPAVMSAMLTVYLAGEALIELVCKLVIFLSPPLKQYRKHLALRNYGRMVSNALRRGAYTIETSFVHSTTGLEHHSMYDSKAKTMKRFTRTPGTNEERDVVIEKEWPCRS